MRRKRESSQAFPPDVLSSSDMMGFANARHHHRPATQRRRHPYITLRRSPTQEISTLQDIMRWSTSSQSAINNIEHATQSILHPQIGGLPDDASSAETEEMRVKPYRYNDPSRRGIKRTPNLSDKLEGNLAYIHTMPVAARTRGIQRDRTSKQFGISLGFGTPAMADSRNPNPVVLDEQPGMSTGRQAFPHQEAAGVSQQTGDALISPLVVLNLPQLVPTILIPDLTGLITRCSQDPVCGGTYGNIYKCIYHGPDGDVEVAVKAIRPQFISDQVFRRELGIWKRLRHSHILKFMGTTSDFGPSVALVSPWIPNGTLTSFLKQTKNTLTLLDRMCLLRDIAAGLHYLHTFILIEDGHAEINPVIHGDLTGTNVLIDGDKRAYLADFGLSGTLTHKTGMTYLAKLSCHPGAMRWTAPELLSGEEPASAITTQSDIYSFGNIFLQVLTGNVPWPHLTGDTAILRKVIFERELHPRPDDGCVADQFWNFMIRCWSTVPTDRPSAAEALQFVHYELNLLQSNGGLVRNTSRNDRQQSPCSSCPDSPSLPSSRTSAPSPSLSYPIASAEYFSGVPPQDRLVDSNLWAHL